MEGCIDRQTWWREREIRWVPCIARMVMCSMELFQLFPGKIGDLQWVATRHYPIGVIRENVVLQVLSKYSLIVCLKRNYFSKNKNKSADDR